MFTHWCSPRAYIIISFGLTNDISVFTQLWKSIFSKSWWIVAEFINHLFILSLVLMMNSCYGTHFHSTFPENLTMSSRQFVLHLFFSDILSLRYHDTNRIWISVRYDGWDNFPRVMMLILWWPGNMMSCLAPPPAGGPILIDSFSASYPFFREEVVSLIPQVIPDGSFVFSKSDLHLMTMSMLSRSMSMVLRFSTGTFEAQC